jgi:soluble lytic murein transglycosylase-like protein
MSAESMPAVPVASARRVRRARSSFHLHRSLIFAAVASVLAPAAVHASTGEPLLLAQASETRLAEDAPEGFMPRPEPDQVSAADRLRVDPLETAAVPPEATAKPAPPLKLTKDERTVARHITRSYRVDSGSSERFVHYAYKAARESGLDPHLILAVMAVESGFDANARSAAGAKGLMQVHLKVHSSKFEPFGGPDAVYDPPANIKVGTGILREYVSRYGDVPAGLKAYVGAALLPSDGGYGSKVLNRQAQFDAVLKTEAASLKGPKPEGSVNAVASQASIATAPPESPGEPKSRLAASPEVKSTEVKSTEARSSEVSWSAASSDGNSENADAADASSSGAASTGTASAGTASAGTASVSTDRF